MDIRYTSKLRWHVRDRGHVIAQGIPTIKTARIIAGLWNKKVYIPVYDRFGGVAGGSC